MVRKRGREVTLPHGPRRGVAVPAIDERVSVVLPEQPEIDVVERERQRHAQPVDSRRDLDHLARTGRRRERVVEDEGQRGGHEVGFSGKALVAVEADMVS